PVSSRTRSASTSHERAARMVCAPAEAMCWAIAKPMPRLAPATRAVLPVSESMLFQMHRLREGSIARRIPRREPYPLLSRSVERDAEFVAAERRDAGRGDDLPVGFVAVAPHQFHKLRRKSPL